MSKIYEYTTSYSFTKRYILFFFRRFYRNFIVKGDENLPTDDSSALIFAANHLNALMDALAVASLAKKRKAVIFLARADMFANKLSAKIMHFAKIMPAFRMRDGYENLDKNNRIFLECVNVLRFGHAICIMPEGGQGELRKIRPLVKGIFRIAFEAQKVFGNEKNVKIVPVGIDLEDFNKSAKNIIINIGKPVDVQEYMEKYASAPAIAINEIKETLRERLSNATLDLATNENYETFETVTNIMKYEYNKDGKPQDVAFERFKLQQETVRKLIDIENKAAEKMEELKRLTSNYNGLLSRLKFKSAIFSDLKSDEPSFLRFLVLLFTLPAALFGFLTNALPTFIPVWIQKILKIEYKGFHSSIHFVFGLLTFPFFYISQAVVFQLFISHHWWITLVFLLLEYVTRDLTLKWYKNMRKYIEINRFNGLLSTRTKNSNLLYRLIKTRNRIIQLVKD